VCSSDLFFVSARVGSWAGIDWVYVGQRPESFYPAALALWLVPQFTRQDRFVGFDTAYRVFALLTLFIPMLVLAHFGSTSYLGVDHALVEGGYQVLGFAASAAVVWLGLRKSWPTVTNVGIAFFTVFVYRKFFVWWWDAMPKYLFFLVIALTALLMLFVLRRLRAAMPARDRR
jgi:hypothetical protein